MHPQLSRYGLSRHNTRGFNARARGWEQCVMPMFASAMSRRRLQGRDPLYPTLSLQPLHHRRVLFTFSHLGFSSSSCSTFSSSTLGKSFHARVLPLFHDDAPPPLPPVSCLPSLFPGKPISSQDENLVRMTWNQILSAGYLMI